MSLDVSPEMLHERPGESLQAGAVDGGGAFIQVVHQQIAHRSRPQAVPGNKILDVTGAPAPRSAVGRARARQPACQLEDMPGQFHTLERLSDLRGGLDDRLKVLGGHLGGVPTGTDVDHGQRVHRQHPVRPGRLLGAGVPGEVLIDARRVDVPPGGEQVRRGRRAQPMDGRSDRFQYDEGGHGTGLLAALSLGQSRFPPAGPPSVGPGCLPALLPVGPWMALEPVE
jgi:hypothetical protein